MIELRVLGADDDCVLQNVADGVFDFVVQPDLIAEFLADPRHHLVVAIDQGLVVGMVSGVHYVHPDKPPELWINELGVAPTHRCQGIAKALMHSLLKIGGRLDCREACVLTDRSNSAAIKVYETAGGVQNRQDQVMFEFRLPPNP